MNKRNIALSGIVLIILFAFAVLAWLSKNEPEKQENKPVENQMIENEVPLPTVINNGQTQDTIIIQTPAGGVETKNFYKTAIRVDAREALLVEKANEYAITYFREAGRFKIIIITPFKAEALEAQKQAEQEFLKILNIGESDACKLNPIVLFLKNEDAYLAENIFTLSFCQ
jgi:hypothetical protein